MMPPAMTDPPPEALIFSLADAYAFGGALLALLLRSATIAGEAALGSIGQERARELAETGKAGQALVALKSDQERSAAAIRAFIALCLTLAVALVATEGADLTQALFPTIPSLTGAAITALAVWLLTIVADVVPRSLAANSPENWALRTAPWLLRIRALLTPVTRLVTATVEAILRPFGAKVRFGLPPLPLEEIERLLTSTKVEGAPEPALVRSLFDFGERTVKEIMVPRTDMVAISHDADPREVVELLVEEGHTRIPVYQGTLDTVIGIIHIKDLLPLIATPELLILHDLLRPPLFVPWNRPIAKVMRELQRKRQHIAVVVDEYGGVAGIVTLEDIVEQIVGDIRDEFDDEAETPVPMTDGTSTLRGDLRIAQFNELFGADVPADEGFETLAGFVSSLAGSIPSEGDRFYFGGMEFLVTRRDPRRVLELKVTRTRAGEKPSMAGPPP